MSHLVGLHAIDGNHELSASPFDSYHQLKSTAEISSRPVSSFFCESTLQQYFAAPNRGVCSSAYLPKGKHFLKKRFFFLSLLHSANMLLRSSSTPILHSWLPQYSKDSASSSSSNSSPEPELQVLQRTRSVSLSDDHHHHQSRKQKLLTTIYQRKEIRDSQMNKKGNIRALKPPPASHSHDHHQAKESSSRIQRLFSSSGLGEKLLKKDDDDEKEGCEVEDGGGSYVQTMVMGGGLGNNGGKICDGRGGGDAGGGGGGSGFSGSNNNYSNNNHGSSSTDAYYEKMIEANPGNALLLGNYARFLKEVMLLVLGILFFFK